MYRSLRYVLVIVGFLALLSVPLGNARGYADEHQAGIVVVLEGGQVETRCVTFSETTISGYELLTRSGLPLVTTSDATGTFVCKISGSGCLANDCLCHFPPTYWSYWELKEGAWRYSQAGSVARQVEDGDVDGWVWGDGASPPPEYSFAQICLGEPVPATPTATATQQSPATPTMSPTETPEPEEVAVRFWAEENEVEAGSCTNLHWQTAHARSVTLDGRGMPDSGAQQVCPCEDTTYWLAVTASDDTTERFPAEVLVTGSCPGAQATVAPTATPGAAATATPATSQPIAPGVEAAPSDATETVSATAAPPEDEAPEAGAPPGATAATTVPQPAAPADEPSLPPAQPEMGLPPDAMMPAPRTTPSPSPLDEFAGTEAPAATLTAERPDVSGTDEPPSMWRWLGYAVFGLLLIGIGGGYIWMQSRQG